MGLRVSDFNLDLLKGKEIVALRIDRKNESTITVADREGHTTRYRIPMVLVNLLEHYRTAAAA